jgi:hypothetical protein
MRISFVSFICVLTTWQALASSVLAENNDATAAASNNGLSRRLRRLEDLGDFTDFTEPPTMALNDTSTAPSTAPDRDAEDTPVPTVASRGDDDTEPAGDTNTEDLAGGDDTEGTTDAPSGQEITPTEGEEGEAGDSAGEEPSGGDGDETGTQEEGTPTISPGQDESPAEGGDNGEDSPAGSPTADEFPAEGDEGGDNFESFPTPSPTPGRTEYPTAGRPSFDDMPTEVFPSPTADYPFESPSYVPPTPKPYVSNDDEDPILGPTIGEATGGSSSESGYAWDNSSIEDLEHDQTVVIALSVVFGVMFLFSVIVAHQMLENPHGCCARYVVGK